MGGLGSKLSRLFKRREKPARSRVRLLVWATLAGLVFGAVDFGSPIENALRTGRNSVRQHKASGDIVIVGVDNRSLDQIGKWPWPRRNNGVLVDNLRKLGARRIVFDINFSSPSDPKEDRAFADALARSEGKVILATRFVIDPASGKRTHHYPIPAFRRHVNLGTVNFRYNNLGQVWALPYALKSGGQSHPSLGALLGNVRGEAGDTFPVDYSIDPASVPVVSIIDIIN